MRAWCRAIPVGGVALVLAGCLSGKEQFVNPSIAAGAPEDAVRTLAAQEFDWSQGDIEVVPIQGLTSRQGCQFFSARNPRLLDGPVYGYAVLPDRTMLGPRQEGRAARILLACGEGGDALWWATVVARFGGTGGGLLVDEHAPSAIRRLKASGVADHRPTLARSAAGTVVTFYTQDYSRSQTWRVRATLTPGGELVLDRQML